ncbi:hypothetical protein BGZ65_001683 [Modicella reniformis]|uniref:Galactose oxidase n=1 Tax=Modicella reniformis TaxID=1440133 RepID=A0A9P6J1K1_9FUNG|nr:hypothetical protein BGZ65_001683 [Modicella reniformis]
MTARGIMHYHFYIISIVYLGCLSILSGPGNGALVHAQPQPCGGPAFARVGNKFYLHGGAIIADNLLQHFWELDLTIPWNTTAPAWSNLPLGPGNAYHSAGYSADNNSFIIFGRDTGALPEVVTPNWINVYDITTKVWSFGTNPPSLVETSRRDFYVVSNPDANKIYILGGNAGVEGTISSNAFDVYDPDSRSMTETPTPLPGPQDISTYSAVWVPRLKAMLVIGGHQANVKGNPFQGVYLYHPATGSWTTQVDTDGSLVAMFSGFIHYPGTGEPFVYILDTVTWTWTTKPSQGRGRGNAACTIADDTFIIWGGFYNAPNTVNGVPTGAEALLLFSLSRKEWLTTYTPDPAIANRGGGRGGGNGGSNISVA